MILGLDVSTSITGVTVIDNENNVVFNEAWDTRKYKNFFRKAEEISKRLDLLPFTPTRIFVEQSLQSFRSGFSSAKTLSTLARINGIVSWICYRRYAIEPEYIAATSARKMCGIKVPRGTKAKQVVLQFLLDNEPNFNVTYTPRGNPKPGCYDKADSIIVARAGYNIWKNEKSSRS
tara:strand:- start:228 stop:755 length:528 start_codon:yes stop_codon:yes gene_type:complete